MTEPEPLTDDEVSLLDRIAYEVYLEGTKMGDRCSASLQIAEQDLERVKGILGEKGFYLSADDLEEHSENDRGILTFEIEEINYGGGEDWAQLAEAGVKFSGNHANGGGYSGHEFFSNGDGKLWEIQAPDHIGPCVAIGPGGVPYEGELKHALEYCEAEKILDAYFDSIREDFEAAQNDSNTLEVG